MQKKNYLLLIAITIVGAGLRLYNLMWGSPYFFHPDERNIVYSLLQLNFPTQMNPHFFAYGTIPIYVVYFLGLLFTKTLHQPFDFPQTVFLLRLVSSILSVLLIPLMYSVGKKIQNETVGLLSAIFTTLSVGFIQFAHFGTFEMWLTFFSVLLFYITLLYIKNHKLIYIIFLGIICGVLIGVKVSSVFLLPLLIGVILLSNSKHRQYKIFLQHSLLCISLAGMIFVITNPFVFLDTTDFLNSMRYESSVAIGTQSVFYTQVFQHTIPVIFQFFKIYPFLLNPLLTLLFIPSFVYVLYIGIKQKNSYYLLLVTSYVLLFASQAFLFVKWTRYMIPTLPFMYLMISVFLYNLVPKTKSLYRYTSISVLLLTACVFCFAYVKTVLWQQDSRVNAAMWTGQYIPSRAKILSEIYDLGIMPFNQYFPSITLFDFYTLDTSFSLQQTLPQDLSQNDYIILPSQRLIASRLSDKKDFPYGNDFYINLTDGAAGFKEIYETPCDLWCKILYIGNPVFSFEQTASVFDRPTVSIFKKNE